MRPLDRKLLRDLRRLWLQSLAVVIVLGCGIATYVMSVGMYDSLERAQEQYYAQARLADLQAQAVRVPNRLLERIVALPGIAAHEARVTGLGLVSAGLESSGGTPDPVSVQLMSIPDDRRAAVNDLQLLEGRWPDPIRNDEVLVNESFAEAHELALGQRLSVLVRGAERRLVIVGVASSPEFVFVVPPGELLPEPGRFGVLWIPRKPLARMLDLDGAFNDLVLRLSRNAESQAVVGEIDRLLEDFGGRGAFDRSRMLSVRYLADELTQLRGIAAVLPPIFLGVAVFLLNMMLSRLVETERANIGLLKAFGYSSRTIAAHYAGYALTLGAAAAVLGSVLGWISGRYMGQVYESVYRIPELQFDAPVSTYLGAVSVALLVASAGALFAVRRAVRLAPAMALSPPSPTTFARLGRVIETWLGRIEARLRIVARRVSRFPRRALSTIAGFALALALLILAQYFPKMVERLIEVNFGVTQRMDATAAFYQSEQDRVLTEIRRLPGVLAVEPQRAVEVIFRHGSTQYREALLGIEAGASLNRIVDTELQIFDPQSSGVTLTRGLASKLGVSVGDRLQIEPTEGRRLPVEVDVVAIVQPFLGAPAYMEREALGRLLREPDRVNLVHLQIDAREREALSGSLRRTPAIAGVAFTDKSERSLRELFEQGAGFFNFMFVGFAFAMAAGIAFSAARVTFGEQARDLATLRVMGFRRWEASTLLLAELLILLIPAIPLGILAAIGFCRWLTAKLATEIYSFPFELDPASVAQAVCVFVLAVAASALWVRRQVDTLDLVTALKVRE